MTKPMKMRVSTLLLCLLAMLGNVALGEANLYQVSTYDALESGQYDGVVSVETWLGYGDTGLGIMDSLDGEMITLDGVVFRIKADGSGQIVPSDQTIPFGVVTKYKADTSQTFATPIEGIDALTTYLNDAALVKQSANRMYVIRLDGYFDVVRTRSVAAQEAPYLPLSEVTEDQSEFTYEALEGTIVGVFFPDDMADLNMPGWHLHFISKDRSQGGHLLDVQIGSGILTLDAIDQMTLVLPQGQEAPPAEQAEYVAEVIYAEEK